MELNQLFSDADIADLVHRELALRPDGMGRISVRNDQLEWMWSDLYQLYRDFDIGIEIPADAFSTIPTHLISYATLEFVGFTPEEAASMWALWRSRFSEEVPRNKRDFESWVKVFRHFLHIRLFEGETGMPNCYFENAEAWQACMKTYGITVELQREILSPPNTLLRQRCPWDYSCLAWVKDEIYGRFCSLGQVRRESLSRMQFAVDTAEEELERHRDIFAAMLAQLRPDTAAKVDGTSETPSSSSRSEP